MDNQINFGIIGCGSIAKDKHIPSLLKQEQCKITGLYNRTHERAELLKQELQLSDAKVYRDLDELLEDKNIDVVHICTSNKSHSEITIAALNAGKHVMVEKPMALNSVESQKMVEAAEKSGKKLTICMQNRFCSDVQYLKTLCQNGDLGEIYFAKALALRRRGVPVWGEFLNQEAQGGGALIDIGVHSLDITLWLMDNYNPLYVAGKTYTKLGKEEGLYNTFGPWDINKFTVDESGFGFIVMKNGATVILESSWALNIYRDGEAQCMLCGTKAGADMENGLRINTDTQQKLGDFCPSISTSTHEQMQYEAFDLQMEKWVEALINDTPPVVSMYEMHTVTQIIDALYASSKNNSIEYC